MPFMLLIVEPAGQRRVRTPAEGRAVYARMVDYSARLKDRGVLLATNSLRRDAARLRIEGGEKRVGDGPFAESKELIGGYFLLGCDTREQALGFAADCPAAEWASIEVRETGPCYD
ncbi:MAG: YciI family protein [Steroidobacteraceae bacterium]